MRPGRETAHYPPVTGAYLVTPIDRAACPQGIPGLTVGEPSIQTNMLTDFGHCSKFLSLVHSEITGLVWSYGKSKLEVKNGRNFAKASKVGVSYNRAKPSSFFLKYPSKIEAMFLSEDFNWQPGPARLNAPLNTVLYCTALPYTALHCTVLHCTALQCTELHCAEVSSGGCFSRHACLVCQFRHCQENVRNTSGEFSF